MKCIIKQTPKDKKTQNYPVLKKCTISGVIILFTSPNCGVLMGDPGKMFSPGYNSSGWDEDICEVFDGSVTLSNT